MKKWVMISLIAVFFFAIFMRLYPLGQYEIWGSDSGEYFRITNQLTDDGYVDTEYDGWGFGYPYFPGMFHLSGSISLVSGIGNLNSMIFFIPIASAFSVLLVFILARMLFKNNEAGVLAGALTAVAMPHVFATSHPMPGTLGDLLLVLSLLLFIGSFQNRKFLPLLVLSSIALIFTHHLSSYFFFIMGLGGLFVAEILRKESEKNAKYLWAHLVIFLTILIVYWSIFAQPFADRVVTDAFDFPSWILLSGGYIFIILAFIIVKLRRRSEWMYEPEFPKPKVQVLKYMVLLIALILTLGVMTITSAPGTSIDLEPATILLFLPFLALTAFGSIGPGYIRFHKNGMMVYGWMMALFLSLMIGFLTSNRVLLPFRHPQYLIMPLALLMGIGIAMLFGSLSAKKTRAKTYITAIILVLIILTAFSAYPSKDLMGGFQEGTSSEDMQAVLWAQESLESDATVASDHRMSSMIFGFGGLNATWDAAENTLLGESYDEFRDELESIDTPSGDKPIDYVLLDDDIKEGAALLQWENAKPMSQAAQDKFQKWPFVKLYEAGGVEIYGIVE